jgi:hypothetical protein
MTLYEKTNNPLNIRFNKDNNWKGQTTTLRGFDHNPSAPPTLRVSGANALLVTKPWQWHECTPVPAVFPSVSQP